MREETAVGVSNLEFPNASLPPIQPSVEIPDLCRVLGTVGEARIPVLFQNRKLYQLDAEIVDELVTPKPGIPLNAMLKGYAQSTRERMILAYILARSVWQYYECDWIMSRWRAESIHFIQERLPGGEGTEAEYVNLTAPYFALKDPGETGFLTGEYMNDVGLVHKYPWLVALGILLVDTCRKSLGAMAEASDAPSNIARMNNEHAHYWQIVNRDKNWPFLDLKNQEVALEYRKIVECCLNQRTFKDAPSVEERRAVILNRIVHPLHCLLVKMEWLDELGSIRELRPRNEPRPPDQRVSSGILLNHVGIFDSTATNKSGER